MYMVQYMYCMVVILSYREEYCINSSTEVCTVFKVSTLLMDFSLRIPDFLVNPTSIYASIHIFPFY